MAPQCLDPGSPCRYILRPAPRCWLPPDRIGIDKKLLCSITSAQYSCLTFCCLTSGQRARQAFAEQFFRQFFRVFGCRRKRERGEGKEGGGGREHQHAGHVPSYSEIHFLVAMVVNSWLTRSSRLLPAVQGRRVSSVVTVGPVGCERCT